MKFRPQILMAIVCVTAFALFVVWIGYKMNAIEIVTAIVAGTLGFMGGVSLKILESD